MLERRLRQRNPDTRIEVINASSLGATSGVLLQYARAALTLVVVELEEEVDAPPVDRRPVPDADVLQSETTVISANSVFRYTLINF